MIKDATVNRKLPVLNFVKNHSVLKCPLLYFAEITSLPNTMFIFKASLEISRAVSPAACGRHGEAAVELLSCSPRDPVLMLTTGAGCVIPWVFYGCSSYFPHSKDVRAFYVN